MHARQGLVIVTLSGSEEPSPDAPREMLRFAQHDGLNENHAFEKALACQDVGL